jgi:magnesium chelatase family protein
MLAIVSSATLVGVQGRRVAVEVHVTPGLPGFHVVGLPDTSCREARDRVRAALVSGGFRWPQQRVTVNLAPSGLRKAGSGLDLPMAVGLLAASGQLHAEALADIAFVGELGLDGSLRQVPGVLPLVGALRQEVARVPPTSGALPAAGGPGSRTPCAVVVPPECAREALLIGGLDVRTAANLQEVVAALEGRIAWSHAPEPFSPRPAPRVPDLADVKGQALGRQALEVSAAGAHHLLIVGPAGAGKTMLAKRLPGLLPDLTAEEALEVAMIHSSAGGELTPTGLSRRPPFRSPHHSASAVSLVGGGGARLRPGEISCAHRGVLFMDELAEFPGPVLDNLRQPLEEGRIVVCRASATVEFPARFLLVAATNACRCGGDGSPGSCRCRPAARARYVGRISGPLLDRFDLRVRVRRPEAEEIIGGANERELEGEPTCVVAARVAAARERAHARGVPANSQLAAEMLPEVAPLSASARRLLERRLRDGGISARGLDRIRRVALTVADLGGDQPPLGDEHVLVALALRSPGILGTDEDTTTGTARPALRAVAG